MTSARSFAAARIGLNQFVSRSAWPVATSNLQRLISVPLALVVEVVEAIEHVAQQQPFNFDKISVLSHQLRLLDAAKRCDLNRHSRTGFLLIRRPPSDPPVPE
jgi:hypothetical protein